MLSKDWKRKKAKVEIFSKPCVWMSGLVIFQCASYQVWFWTISLPRISALKLKLQASWSRFVCSSNFADSWGFFSSCYRLTGSQTAPQHDLPPPCFRVFLGLQVRPFNLQATVTEELNIFLHLATDLFFQRGFLDHCDQQQRDCGHCEFSSILFLTFHNLGKFSPRCMYSFAIVVKTTVLNT